MNSYIIYGIIFITLSVLEVLYFQIADRFNIIDRPNERSSHSMIVLRGGGIIFLIGIWIWSLFYGFKYPWFLAGATLIAGLSLADDIRSLPRKVRLMIHFTSMVLMFIQLNIMHLENWWVTILALIIFVGATNVINFMDGINGITGAYAMASLIPLYLINENNGYVDSSLIITIALADIIFCFFNMRPKGKAKCFAGDIGSIGIAFILLFMIGRVIYCTGDITYLIFLLVYGIDGGLTILHRIMLHENLGEAHRKHAFQIMCNELKIGHIKVSLMYSVVQLCISLGFIYLCPDNIMAHWIYLIATTILLSMAYIVFIKKYYHLHEEYLATIVVSE